ncbi:MAG: hypothetical protein JSV23_02480 [Promethearchaeota archaeon]|nr:MAG: hypothetical protein JSV23_02480 [Candidatus Lokiarchaeota archaeon]
MSKILVAALGIRSTTFCRNCFRFLFPISCAISFSLADILILGLASSYINFITRNVFFFFIKTYLVDLTSQESIRAGDIVGDHTIIYGGPGERIELKHQAHSRECFAEGAIKAIKFIVKAKENKIYSTSEVLGLS